MDPKPLQQALGSSITSSSGKVYGQPGTCPDCGAEKELVTNPICSVWSAPCECAEKRKEAERQEAIRQAIIQIRKERIDRYFQQSRLGERFRESTFDNWQEIPGAAKAFKAAREFVARWPEMRVRGEGLLFYGIPGNGKSHLAAAIVNELIPQEVAAVFQDTPELLARFRSTYQPGAEESEQALLDVLADADLLVLDDVGAEKWSEWVEMQLFRVINARYRHKRPLIVTSNLGMDKLSGAIGPRSLSRLIEMCRLIEVTAPDYRVKIAEQRGKRRAEG